MESIRMTRRVPALLLMAAVLGAAASPQRMHAGGQTTNDGVITAEQTRRGEAVYQQKCSRCHLDDLTGGDRSPALVGDGFFEKWIGGDVSAFVDRARSMPSDAPASLTDADYVDIAAFLLNANGVPVGSTPLATDAAVLKAITIQKPK